MLPFKAFANSIQDWDGTCVNECVHGHTRALVCICADFYEVCPPSPYSMSPDFSI